MFRMESALETVGGGGAETAATGRRSWTLPAGGLIVAAVIAAYGNSLAGPFIYDDVKAIVENPTIRRLWPLGPVLSPPGEGQTVSGRPLLNLTLALNYALSGLDVWSYHAANLAIHLAAALLLFGVLRRTFCLPALAGRLGLPSGATGLALAIALDGLVVLLLAAHWQ